VNEAPAIPPELDAPDVPVTTIGATAIVTANVCEAVAPLESVTVTFMLKLPGADGVPLTAIPENETPGGKPLAEKEYGGTPPLAPTLPEYGVPTVPFGNAPVTASGAAEMVSVKLALAIFPAESITVTATWYAPADPGGGVPLIEPLEKAKNAGMPTADQVYGGCPPEALNCAV
jgi:hypothetical protein